MRFTFSAKTALIGCAVALAACAPASVPTNTTNTAANATANKANAPAAPGAPTAPTAPAVAEQQGNVPHPEINRISTSDAQALIAKKEAVIVDVRGADAYATGHIKGALHIPGSETEARLKELPRDKRIITYCS